MSRAGADIPRAAERQRGIELAGPLAALVDTVAADLHRNESLHLHDGSGPLERCGYCYLRAGRTLGIVAQHGGEETVEILLPLVTWLLDNAADRYAGRHCVDVVIELLNEAVVTGDKAAV